jgi:cell division protein FtsB
MGVASANNRNAYLVRDNEKLRAEVEQLRLRSYLVERGVVADQAQPFKARSKRDCAAA